MNGSTYTAWDVSKVKKMDGMFKENNVFNQPIGNWDVSNVTNMNEMFRDAQSFNQEIRNWDVSNVNSNAFWSMFMSATLMKTSPWDAPDTPSASWFTIPDPNASYQFANKTALQSAINLWISDKSSALSTYGEINTWDTSLITNMYNLLANKPTFNDDISNWNTSNVTNMMMTFSSASTFNQPINTQQVTVNGNTYTAWDVSKVKEMYSIFYGAQAFNQSLSNWNVSNVTKMQRMFMYANAYNQNIPSWGWNVSNVTTFVDMFYGSNLMKGAYPTNMNGDSPTASWFNP